MICVCESLWVGGCTFVCEYTFAPALWLMQDQSFSDPITRVWQARVVCVCVSVGVCVMERIIYELLLVSSILYHCGMLLSGWVQCYITHTYTYTRARTNTHKYRFVLIFLWGRSIECICSLFLIAIYITLKEQFTSLEYIHICPLTESQKRRLISLFCLEQRDN